MADPTSRTTYSADVVNGERVVAKTLPTGERVILRGEQIEIEAMHLERQAAEAAEEEQAAARLTALQSAAESMPQRYPRFLAVNVDGATRYLRQDSADAVPYPLRVWSGMDFIIFGLNVVTAEELTGIEAAANARIAAKMTGRV
jgi:hypothetical protein